MNETLIVGLLTLLINTAGGCFVYWVTRKYGEVVRRADDKQNTVISQNDAIIKQNHITLEQVGQVRQEVNGRLSELINAAVAAALNKGRLQGATDERLRVEIEKQSSDATANVKKNEPPQQ